MLHVLLLILKILLWILLGILGLVLLLILLVLFAPINYKIDAKYYGKAKVYAKVRFLVASVAISFDQDEKQLDNVIRICGIRLKSKDKTDDEVDEVDELDELSEDSHTQYDKVADAVEDVVEDIAENVTDNIKETIKDDVEYVLSDDKEPEDKFDIWDSDVDLSKKEKNIFGRIKVLFKGLLDKIIKVKNIILSLNSDTISEFIEKKTSKIKKIVKRFKIFWNLKCTVKTRAYLKKYLKGLFKHIAPRKVKGHIRFGFNEPYKTGQITGYLSMLPFVYQKHLQWEPDFYNKVIEGELYLKGKIRLGYIARIVLNINIWKTIKAARKIKV